jgi:hypothetical protein
VKGYRSPDDTEPDVTVTFYFTTSSLSLKQNMVKAGLSGLGYIYKLGFEAKASRIGQGLVPVEFPLVALLTDNYEMEMQATD